MAFLALRIAPATLLTILLSTICVNPSTASTDEYELMAAYIYNFAKFTRWPADSFHSRNAPLSLCILGEDPFGLELDNIEGKALGPHTLTIKRYPRVAVVSGCHILFISRSEEHRLELILRDIDKKPILTVSNIKDFSDRGGMIALLIQARKIRFAVNKHATSLVGIEISSKLLELATNFTSSG